MGISINGPSGIDTAWIIESLVNLEYEKVQRVEDQKDAYQVKIDAYSKLMAFINDIGKYATQLQKPEDFNVFTTTSSNEDIVSFSATTGSVEGNYDVQVLQTAQREKLVSSDKLVTSQSATLLDLGIASGKFSINGVEIIVEDTDTIQDVRSKINGATDGDGKKPGVTATVLKLAEDNYRLVITATDTGSSGVEYKDLDGGTFLQDLGIIYDADGDKGITSQKLQSVDDINSAFSALAPGELIEYSGIDNDGNEVSNSFLVTATSTIDDLLAQVESTFHGMVDAEINAGDGTLIITDAVGGKSSLAMSSFTMGGTDYSFNTADYGYAGQNVLSVGKDAYFTVDGLAMQSDKNSASGFITGVTLDFHKASFDEVVNIDLERDFDGITDKVGELVNAYNALVRYVKDSTVYGNEEEGETKGDLAGDMTARMILDQVRSVFKMNFDVSGTSDISSLNMVGLKTNVSTGEFELDRTIFKEALTESFEDVQNLFITRGFSDNSQIVMGTYSDDTSDGVYTLNEMVDGIHYEIQRTLPIAGPWYQSEPRMGDIVMFKDGPATGLSITAPAGSGGATFVFSKGLSGHLDKIVKKLTDSQEGVITMRQESWTKAIERSDDRILTLENRIESYRIRLIKEFAAMEQTLNQLQTQSANMMSQLGYYAG